MSAVGAENFVGMVVGSMSAAGWSTHFTPDEYVYCYSDNKSLESRCMGYIEEEVRELWVALGHSAWLGVLVHEFSHFVNWRNRTKAQRRKQAARYDPALSLLERWTRRKKAAGRRTIIGAAQRVVSEEAKTELTAIRLIRRYALPLDVDVYIQRASCYILSYGFVVENRQWANPGPYKIEAVWSELPVDMKILKNPRAVIKNYRPYAHLFEQHCMEPWDA